MKGLGDLVHVASAGLRAQSSRLRVIAENVANAGSTAKTPGGDPYRRQVPVFETELDRARGLDVVRMTKVTPDRSAFTLKYEPGHPAADETGYVKYPNVSSLIEMMDMRTASRAYEANLNVIENARGMLQRTLELLRR